MQACCRNEALPWNPMCTSGWQSMQRQAQHKQDEHHQQHCFRGHGPPEQA